jgi:hypothetical protein
MLCFITTAFHIKFKASMSSKTAVVLEEITASIFRVDACSNVWVAGRLKCIWICKYYPEGGGSKLFLNNSISLQIADLKIQKNAILLLIFLNSEST